MKYEYCKGDAKEFNCYVREKYEPVGMRLEIEVLSFLDGYHKEELEDKVKKLLQEYGVKARINSSTGNELTVSSQDLNCKGFKK